MKNFTKALSTLLLLTLYFPSFAQEDFAPAGAVWHHNMSAGVFRSTVKNDTTIKGIPCRKITQEALTDAASSTGGYKVHNLRDIYVFSTKDTVFIFNELLNDFSPLYIFNVVAGDIVRLPLLNSSNPCAASPGPGFSFDFIIDSVKNITYGSTVLKTVYSHNITKDHIGWHGDRDNNNVYAEKIGSLLSGLLPNCTGCAIALDARCVQPDTFRCYRDGSMSVQSVSNACDKEVTTIIDINTLAIPLDLYPNPAGTTISIRERAFPFPTQTEVFDAFGKKVSQQVHLAGTAIALDLQQWPTGLYFVQLSRAQGRLMGTGSFVKH